MKEEKDRMDEPEREDLSELVIDEYIERQRDASRRRRRILRLVCILIGLLLLLGVLLACVILFFKVETITVTGNTIYTDERIIECCGIEPEQNIFLVRNEDVAKALGSELPFIYSVRLERRLPSSVELVIFEETPYFVFESDGDWVVMSADMKVLDINSSAEYIAATYPGVREVKVPAILYAVTGDYLLFRDEANKAALSKVLKALDECEFCEDVKVIDFTNRFDIRLDYQSGRFEILLGTGSDADTKLEFARQIIHSFREDATGTICVDDISAGYAMVDDKEKLIK